MEFENYYFAGGQNTLNSNEVVPNETPVQISHDTVRIQSSVQASKLNVTGNFATRQQDIQKKQFTHRKKSIENQSIINDSTLYLIPKPDYFLQQIEVHPKGIILPSQPVRFHYTDWFTILIFFSLILFAAVKYSSKKYFTLLFQSITSYSSSSRMYREQNISLKQGSAVMELFYPLVLALYACQFMKYFELSLPFPNFIAYLICFAAIFTFLLFKELIYKTLGFVSETQSDTREFLFNVKNHNKVLAILLLPLISFIAWSPAWDPKLFLFTGLILIVLFYALYLIRGMEILLKKQYSIFYLFLYLCTLEILPWVLLFKLI